MNEISFKLGNNLVSKGQPCFVIGEVAQAHDGSLGMAHAFIDAIAKTGANAVKFQTHIADAESTIEEPWRVKFSPQDSTRMDYWRRMEFSLEQWNGLKQHTEELGLVFLSSPFSLEAVDLLEKLGVCAWKIASGEVENSILLDRILGTNLPLLVSTGMSPVAEIDLLINRIKLVGAPYSIMQCTSSYPCPPEKIGLNMISFFRERYHCPVGLSDHSGVIYPGLAAATLGVELLEVHVTLSRDMFGPDVSASQTTTELKQLVEGIRYIEKMKVNEIDKDALAKEMIPMRNIFLRSAVSVTDLPAGSVIGKSNISFKKPGTGISTNQIDLLVGRVLKHSIKANHIIQWSDLEDFTDKGKIN